MAGAIQVQQDETACISWGQDLAGESSIACVAVPSPPHTGSFGAFMRLPSFVGFLRTVLILVEQTLQLTDYQLRLWPSAEPIPEQLLKGKPGWADAMQLLLAAPAVVDSVARAGFYILVVGSSARSREVRRRLMHANTCRSSGLSKGSCLVVLAASSEQQPNFCCVSPYNGRANRLH